ncbi:MAG: PilZ domain-containing protein [Candidatus Omnitrophica bacterium]|nr:PilZ domain-containing protein [Candidatus Omnitrophota bacterium]
MEERRRYKRYNLNHKLVYEERSSTASTPIANRIATYTKDVSRGGVRAEMKNVPETGAVVRVEIHNNSFDNPVNADAVIIWKKHELDDSAEVGLSFKRIGWIESDRLFTPEVISA